MNMAPDQKTATAPPVPEIRETTGAGPLTTSSVKTTYSYTRRRVSMGSRLEKIAFWVIAAAALVLLLLLLKVAVPTLFGAAITGAFIATFVGLLTMMNLSQASKWGNAVLGRKVFPVLRAPDADIWRLTTVNATLAFVFTAIYEIVSGFLGGRPFWAGLIVLGGLIAASIFYNRVRTVVIAEPEENN